MPLINTSLPNLIQGVSQQPDAVRFDGQCEEQENALSSVVDGLQKRPAAEFVFDAQKGTSHLIDEDISENAFFHLYKRSDTERYCFTQDGDILRIHNAETGEQCTITEQTTTDFTITNNEVNTSGTYLSSATPKQNIKALTIGDSTFLLNTAEATNNSTATISPDLSNGSLVFIKQGDFTKKYGVKINSITTEIKSRPTTQSDNPLAGNNEDEDDTTKSHMADSVEILKALRMQIAGSATATTATIDSIPFTVTQVGNLMHLDTTSSTAYTITGIDGLSGEGIGVVHREVSSLADLPTTAPHNYKVKVIGDAELNQDNFYCEFKLADNDNAADGEIGEGSWVECAGGLIPTDIDDSLMPRVVVSTAENTFEIRRMSFDRLSSGDLDSNPYPSFLGNAINNLFQYKNRLGFLSQDAVILSEAGFGGYDSATNIQSYNFFRTTVTDLLDSDPIDVSVSSNDVTNLRSAQPFQENLIMFSDNSQFVLKGGELLTPKSVSVTAVTNFDAVNTVDPIPLGSYLYFPFQRGGFSGVREFTVNATSDVYDSNEITAHVPQYIPNNLTSLTGSNTEQIIAMTSGTTLSSAQNTADTSIVFSNYGINKFVSSTSLVFHMSAYQTDAINYITDPTAIFSSTTNPSRTYTLAKDATNSGYTMRGVLTHNHTSNAAYNDSFSTTIRHEVAVSTTRSDTSAFISDLPNLSNYNSFSTVGTSTNSQSGAKFLEFSEFYYPTKFSEFKNKFNDGDGYTIEWFGGIDERKYLNSSAEGVFLWSFTPQNTQRSSGTGDQREYLNVIESSLSAQRHKLSVGYDNGGSASNQTANLITNLDNSLTSHSVDIHRKDPRNLSQPTAENGSFTPIHIVLTGDASNTQIYLNNELVVDIHNINNSPTLSSILPNMSELKLTTDNQQIRPISFRIYNERLTAGQRQFNYNFRYASV